MFCELFIEMPGIIFLAKEKQNVIGVMRMMSCQGRKVVGAPKNAKDENVIGWCKSVWHAELGHHDPLEQHWYLGPIWCVDKHLVIN